MPTTPVPHPMPTTLRDTVNFKLLDREMSALDNNARFIVRQLVADAYALGFQVGRHDANQAAWCDAQAAKDKDERQ